MQSFTVSVAPAVIALLFLNGAARADSADDWNRMRSIQPRGYVCYRATQPVKIDGQLDDAAWRNAAWTEDFIDIEGTSKPRPRFRTRAKMLWDETCFYISASMAEPHVWGTLTKHDSVIFHDNDFEVFIDPNGDNHEYYEFEMNALNTGWDLFLPRPYKNGGKADNSWEIPGLRTAVHVAGTLNDPTDEDQSWSVEIAIPWTALREFAHTSVPPRDGDQWRVNFSRVEWQHQITNGKYQKVPQTREDNWVWSPQGIIDMHRPERWGFVQFSHDTSHTARFRLASDWKTRETLMTVYHEQKAFQQQHGRWAANLDDLGLQAFAKQVTMGSTPAGFQADLPAAKGSARWLHVRHDSKLWATDATADVRGQITKILTQQAQAWNRGDIDGFMDHYWRSDKLTFSSAGTTKRGWESTRQNYQERYPTRESMGRVQFTELEVTPLGDSAAQVLGRWALTRDTDPIGGNFSLILRQINGRWLIVHDHTSRLDAASQQQ